MFVWLSLHSLLLFFLGLSLCAQILLFFKKWRDFRDFDHCSKNFIPSLFEALHSMKLSDVSEVCKSENNIFSRLIQKLIQEKEAFERLQILERESLKAKTTLEHHIDWFTLLAWGSPWLGMLFGIAKMLSLFVYTDELLNQNDFGPKYVASQLIFAFAVFIVGLSLSLSAYFAKRHLLNQAQFLRNEFEQSGEEVIQTLHEIEGR